MFSLTPGPLPKRERGFVDHPSEGKGLCQYAKMPGYLEAIRAAIDEALDTKATGEKRIILFNLSRKRHYDTESCRKYPASELQDNPFLAEALKTRCQIYQL